MSLLSTFIQKQLLKALEDEFVAHEPDIQATILSEVEAFANQALSWVNSKLQKTTEALS